MSSFSPQASRLFEDGWDTSIAPSSQGSFVLHNQLHSVLHGVTPLLPVVSYSSFNPLDRPNFLISSSRSPFLTPST